MSTPLLSNNISPIPFTIEFRLSRLFGSFSCTSALVGIFLRSFCIIILVAFVARNIPFGVATCVCDVRGIDKPHSRLTKEGIALESKMNVVYLLDSSCLTCALNARSSCFFISRNSCSSCFTRSSVAVALFLLVSSRCRFPVRWYASCLSCVLYPLFPPLLRYTRLRKLPSLFVCRESWLLCVYRSLFHCCASLELLPGFPYFHLLLSCCSRSFLSLVLVRKRQRFVSAEVSLLAFICFS